VTWTTCYAIQSLTSLSNQENIKINGQKVNDITVGLLRWEELRPVFTRRTECIQQQAITDNHLHSNTTDAWVFVHTDNVVGWPGSVPLQELLHCTCDCRRAKTNVTAFLLHARAIRSTRIRVAQIDFGITQILRLHTCIGRRGLQSYSEGISRWTLYWFYVIKRSPTYYTLNLSFQQQIRRNQDRYSIALMKSRIINTHNFPITYTQVIRTPIL